MIGLTSYVKWFCTITVTMKQGEIVAIEGEYAIVQGDDHEMYTLHHERLTTAHRH